jgi:hypothetical protein
VPDFVPVFEKAAKGVYRFITTASDNVAFLVQGACRAPESGWPERLADTEAETEVWPPRSSAFTDWDCPEDAVYDPECVCGHAASEHGQTFGGRCYRVAGPIGCGCNELRFPDSVVAPDTATATSLPGHPDVETSAATRSTVVFCGQCDVTPWLYRLTDGTSRVVCSSHGVLAILNSQVQK